MAKKIAIIPAGAGAVQGYTEQADGTQAMDVNIASQTAPGVSPDNVYFASNSGGFVEPADVVVFPAAGAGVRNYMTGLQYLNSSGTSGEIVVKDGANVIWRGYAAGGMETPAIIPFNTPLKGSANTAMLVGLLMGQMAVRVSAQGFKGA